MITAAVATVLYVLGAVVSLVVPWGVLLANANVSRATYRKYAWATVLAWPLLALLLALKLPGALRRME